MSWLKQAVETSSFRNGFVPQMDLQYWWLVLLVKKYVMFLKIHQVMLKLGQIEVTWT